MTIGEIRDRMYAIVDGLFWAGDVNYSPFEEAYQEAIDEVEKLIAQLKEEA